MFPPAFALSTFVQLKQCGAFKTGSPDCVCTSTLIFVKHYTLSFCVSYPSLMMTFTGLFHHKTKHLHTRILTHRHTHLLTIENDWVPLVKLQCKKGKWLTSLLSLSWARCLFFLTTVTSPSLLFSSLTSLCSRLFCPFSLFSHSSSLCPALSFHFLSLTSSLSFSLFFSGDGDWQMI